jgi:hypothetical protein
MENHLLQQYEVHTFRDFVTPNHHATIPILGKRSALEALDRTLSVGFHAQPTNLDNEHAAYGPLVIALNTICADRNAAPTNESELYNLQSMPGFMVFAKEFIRTNHAQRLINIDNLLNTQGTLTEDHMVLMTAAFATFYGHGHVGLGIVTLVNGQSVKAFHYPDSNHPPDYTAWVIADFRGKEAAYYGIGDQTVQQQRSVPEKEESPDDTVDDDADDEDTQVPSTTPRRTATRVLLQQVPLPAGLTADNILQHHKSRLQYNNILKVALIFSNQTIADHCRSDLLPKNEQLRHTSAVVKRINTAINWIEDQFEIDNNAFRTAFDQERKINSIPIRGKGGVSDEVLTVNSSKINAAMAWIRAGGSLSTHTVASAPYDSNSNTTYNTAPVSMDPFSGAHGLGPYGPVPPGYIPTPTIPAEVQTPLTGPGSGYRHHLQVDVSGNSNGDISGGTMGSSGDNRPTKNNGRGEDIDVTGVDDETGMEGAHDWNPEGFDFERFLTEAPSPSWESIG